MKRIYKYPIEIRDEQTISVPKDSKILAIQTQNEQLVVYALVDINQKEMQTIEIRIFGTGHDLDINMTSWTYLGTVMTYHDKLVWHIFYK